MQIKYFVKLGGIECRATSSIEQGSRSYVVLGIMEQAKTPHPQK